MIKEKIQLASLLDHGNLSAVETAISEILGQGFDIEVIGSVTRIFKQTVDVFQGRYPGYRSCTTGYHNLHHTIDVFIATLRLLDGHRLAGIPFKPIEAVNLATAALFHDIGYIQTSDDLEGTGAKYTKTHVTRGVQFLQRHYADFGIPAIYVPEISRMIFATDLALECDQNIACTILATADLLGQMADRAYLEKLLFLFYEFREAGFDNYQTAFDLLKSTQQFYQVILQRMDHELNKAYEKVVLHFQNTLSISSNLYMTAIENQMEYLQAIITDTSTNFRKKLKRMDLEIR